MSEERIPKKAFIFLLSGMFEKKFGVEFRSFSLYFGQHRTDGSAQTFLPPRKKKTNVMHLESERLHLRV